MTLHRMIISTFGHVISLSLHKFVYKLIFFQQTVAAAASRHFIKSLHLVRLNTRIPNKERYRFVGMCTQLAGSGMIGQKRQWRQVLPNLSPLHK